ncbi:MAG: hypothetical protein JWM30_2611 [Burkholderia sp.]|jgi:hypothetical protein|nr:hypothetical protein [Burkholderia sp.]
MTPEPKTPLAELSADAYRKCMLRIDVGMAAREDMSPEEQMHQAIDYAVASARCLEARQLLEIALERLAFY